MHIPTFDYAYQPGVWQEILELQQHRQRSERNTPYIFVEPALKGRGLGDQLQISMHTAALASRYNVTYVGTPFSNDRGNPWNDYLGLHRDELYRQQIRQLTGIETNKMQQVTFGWGLNAGEYEQKLIETIERCKRNYTTITPRRHSTADGCYIQLEEAMLPLDREDVACDPLLVKQFRRKYCIQRVEHPELPGPLPPAQDSSNPLHFLMGDHPIIPVAVHYRTGDLSTSTWCRKHQPLSTVINAIYNVHTVLGTAGFSAIYHVYTQPPENNRTVEQYFSALLKNKRLRAMNTQIVIHADVPATTTFHRLITAPILIASGSGFCTTAQYLRSGPTVGIRPSCARTTVMDDRGHFDSDHFTRDLHEWIAEIHDPTQWTEFKTVEQCDAITEWPPVNTYDPHKTYAQQNFTKNCFN